MADFEHGDGSEFGQLLGKFGTHAEPKRRAKAERAAMVAPGKPGLARPCPFNVRISTKSRALALELVRDLSARDGRSWSQADLIEEAISVLASTIASTTKEEHGATNGLAHSGSDLGVGSGANGDASQR